MVNHKMLKCEEFLIAVQFERADWTNDGVPSMKIQNFLVIEIGLCRFTPYFLLNVNSKLDLFKRYTILVLEDENIASQ